MQKTFTLLLGLFLVSCSGSQEVPQKSPNEMRGGSEGTGGGSGVACYDANGKLLRVQTLEAWEGYKPLDNSPLQSNSRSPVIMGVSKEELLNETRSFLEKHVPLFHARLKIVSDHMPFDTWTPVKDLPRVEDATPARSLPSHCRLVQLAIRYTISKPNKLPQVRVEYDPDLFNVLSAFDQALLILHEEMYLLGVETGHKTSDSLRPIVALLLSKELRDLLEYVHSFDKTRILRKEITRVYGDYHSLFLEDPSNQPNFIPVGYSQWSRSLSYGRAAKLFKELTASCASNISDYCYVDNFHTPQANQMNDEEAFLFMAIFNEQQGWFGNAEPLTLWNKEHPEKVNPLQANLISKTCKTLKHVANSKNLTEVIAQAERYCSEVLKVPFELLEEKKTPQPSSEKLTILIACKRTDMGFPSLRIGLESGEIEAISKKPFQVNSKEWNIDLFRATRKDLMQMKQEALYHPIRTFFEPECFVGTVSEMLYRREQIQKYEPISNSGQGRALRVQDFSRDAKPFLKFIGEVNWNNEWGTKFIHTVGLLDKLSKGLKSETEFNIPSAPEWDSDGLGSIISLQKALNTASQDLNAFNTNQDPKLKEEEEVFKTLSEEITKFLEMVIKFS